MNLPDDPILRSLLPEFCAEWERELTISWASHARPGAQSAELLRRLVHTARGSFAQFGVEGGVQLVNELDARLREGDRAGAEAVVQRLLALVAEVRATLAATPPPDPPEAS